MRIFTLRHQLEPPKPNYPQIIVCWKGRHEDISFNAVIMQSRQGLRGSEIQDLWYYVNYYIKSQKSWIIFNLFKTQEEKKWWKNLIFFVQRRKESGHKKLAEWTNFSVLHLSLFCYLITQGQSMGWCQGAPPRIRSHIQNIKFLIILDFTVQPQIKTQREA